MLELVILHSWHVCVIIGLTSTYFNFSLFPSDSPCSLYLPSTFFHHFRVLWCLCPSRAWLVVFIHIVAALFTFVYFKHTYFLEPTVSIPWLLIVDSKSVYPYTSLDTLGYSLWTGVLAFRSSLSQPTKWPVHFLNPEFLSIVWERGDAMVSYLHTKAILLSEETSKPNYCEWSYRNLLCLPESKHKQ